VGNAAFGRNLIDRRIQKQAILIGGPLFNYMKLHDNCESHGPYTRTYILSTISLCMGFFPYKMQLRIVLRRSPALRQAQARFAGEIDAYYQ
jgi:hypothetical protein